MCDDTAALSLRMTPIHGNYHGYYTKRPFVNDPRLALLPKGLFTNARVLDVGCNEGWVTIELAQSFGVKHVVGVDIDEALVEAAWRRRRLVWSLQAPSKYIPLPAKNSKDAGSASRKRPREEDEHLNYSTSMEDLRDYFPASCPHEFGVLPVPPGIKGGTPVFPHNITFRTADWVKETIPDDRHGYHVVIAFSISKWIHLNSGDNGLKEFFSRVHSVLEPGGSFVLEPQSWDSYAKVKRMDQRLKENMKNLKLRPEDFESVLCDLGFSPAAHYGYTGEKGFRRPINLYVKQRCSSSDGQLFANT